MDGKKADSVQSKYTAPYKSSDSFCVIATISIDDLTECLQEQFKDNKPPLPLIESLFQRFRPLKVGTGKEGMDRGQGIEQG